MDIAEQRGSKNLLKSLQEGAKRVSESNGLGQGSFINTPLNISPAAGAAASLSRSQLSVPAPQTPKRMTITEGFSEKRFVEHLLESVSTLESTHEYFNAVNSLFTLYAMGQLTEGVLGSISREDLREVKGIVREFKGILDSY